MKARGQYKKAIQPQAQGGLPGRGTVWLGCLLVTAGFGMLATCPPMGDDWRSATAATLLVAGYAVVSMGLWMAAGEAIEGNRTGWLGAAVFLGTLAAYVHLLHPGPAPFISSEVTAAGATLGIMHMPGYPLYILVFKLFAVLFPLGNIAYRVNLGNAVIFAACNWIFFALLLRLLQDRVLAALGALIFFGARTLLIPALAAETVSLDILLTLLMIYIGCRDRPALPLLGFLFGLGLGGHYTIGLLGPAFAYLVAKKWGVGVRQVGFAGLTLLLGLSVYLYLPIRSPQNPMVASDRIESVAGFTAFLTRKGLGSLHYAPENVVSLEKTLSARLTDTGKYLRSALVRNYTIWGLICVILGCIWLLVKETVYGIFFLLFFGVPFLIMGSLAGLATLDLGSFERATFDRIATLWYPALCLWLIVGCHAIADAIRRRTGMGEPLGRQLARCLCLPSLIVAMAPLPSRYNYREAFHAHDYIQNISRSLPQGGLLLFPGDIAFFGSLYFQYVEGRRPDAGFFHQSRLVGAGPRAILSSRWPEAAPREAGLSLVGYVAALINNAARRGHPVLIEPHSGNMSSIDASGLALKPLGMFKVVEGGRLPLASRLAPLQFLMVRNGIKTAREDNPSTDEIFVYYAGAYAMWGDTFAKRTEWDRALDWYRRAFLMHEHPIVAYKIAWALLGMGQQNSAEYWFKRTIELDRRFDPAYRDLAALYHRTGREGEAARLQLQR